MADDDAIEYDDDRVCKVYDKEDFFTVFVQLMLAAFALFSLWFKRQRESPKRTFRTWFLDVAKQGVGAIYAHVLNMVRHGRGSVTLYSISTVLILFLSKGDCLYHH